MSQDVVVVAGGPPADWPELTGRHGPETVWIGVDRGAYHLIQRGITPHVAIGDFDSLSVAELREVQSQVAVMAYAPPEKDATDTQLGLGYAFEHYPKGKVTLIGATGGRLDHFLSNLWLPLEAAFKPFLSQLTLADRQNTLTYYEPGTHVVTKEATKTYLAFVCLTPVTRLTLVGTKYLLTQHDTSHPYSFASNEFTAEPASFSFAKGIVAVIQSVD